MDKAKSAVQGFLHKDGKHDTTVHETTNPAVQNEHVTRTQHNQSQTAVDREVHQDHHHTSVQPVKDHEVLPEKHTHQMAPVEHRTFEHGNNDHTHQRLEKERAQFQNTREIGDVQHSHGQTAAIGGEHVHHHVHESIQPVIQKETVQPSVVHTTQPIHEVHHNEAKHHNASTLPAVSMSEFQKNGGLRGSETRHDAFSGPPKDPFPMGGTGAHGTTSVTQKDGSDSHHNSNITPGRGNNTTGITPGHGNNVTNIAPGHGNNATNKLGHGNQATTNSTPGHVGAGTAGTHKPSLLDKLNPKKDSDGDGKAGFLD